MFVIILQVVFIVTLPAFLIYIAKKQKALKFIGPIMLAYLSGMIIANISAVPWDKELSMSISEIAVPIAIPLVLMSTNLLKWLKLAKTTILSFVLVMIAALVASLLTVFIFRNSTDIAWKLAGMLTGCYTGGTPNLMAVGMSLEVPSATIIMINTSDMLWGGMYFLLLTSIIKKIYRKFLPAFISTSQSLEQEDHFMQSVFVNGRKNGIKNIIITLIIAIVAAAIAIGISVILTGGISLIPVLLMVSTFGVGLSFSKKIHKIEGTWHVGQYIILLFSIGLGGTVDFKAFFTSSPTMILYTGTMMMSAIIIHFILCKIFKIDADTALITSTAGIYGPAFIAPVANALNNQEIVVSGLITGLAGYAIGNYLGLGIAMLMKLIM